MRRSRPAAVVLLAAVLLLVLPSSAFAVHDEWAAHADGEGFLLAVPDVIDVGGGTTAADLTVDPTAHALGVGFLLSDGSISEVDIDTDGVLRRDPEEGKNCAGPELPEPLDIADNGCSFARGDTAGANSAARASATGSVVSLTGGDVAAVVEFLLSTIDEAGLNQAVNDAEDQVLDPAREALATACLEILDPTGTLFNDAADLIETIDEQGGDVLDLPGSGAETCTLLITYVENPPVISDDVLADLQATLEAALDGASLLDVTLAGSDSVTDEGDAAITATADALGADVLLPSLRVLTDALNALTAAVDDFIQGVEDDLAAVLNEPPTLPAVQDVLATLTAAIPQELQDVLSSDDPLIRVTGGQANPTATYDRDSGEASTGGSVSPLVIDLQDQLAALLGAPDPISIPEGDSQTILADTPLESTFTLSACTSEDGIENGDGLPGARIHCAGLELVLLEGVVGDDPDTEEFDGGITLAGAAGTAEVFGAPNPDAPSHEEPLPTTGGGLALLGLLALGGAIGLTRRP